MGYENFMVPSPDDWHSPILDCTLCGITLEVPDCATLLEVMAIAFNHEPVCDTNLYGIEYTEKDGTRYKSYYYQQKSWEIESTLDYYRRTYPGCDPVKFVNNKEEQ